MNSFQRIILGIDNITVKYMYGYTQPHQSLKLNSGNELSVQACKGVYCIPNSDHPPEGGYTHLEVEFPKLREESIKQLLPYRKFGEIYGNVPVEVVFHVISIEGGLAE